MKKRLSIIALLLLFSLMLASCDSLLGVLPAPMTANALERRVNFKMNDYKSYRVDIEMTYTTYVGGKITGTAKGFMIEDQGEKKDDYYSYMELQNEVKNGSASIRIRTVEAYCDGLAFSIFGDGAATRRLYAEMSVKEYNAYRQGESVTQLNLEDCKSSKMEKTEDGYVLKYSEYTPRAIEQFASASGLDGDLFGEDLKDLIVTMEVSHDYLPTKVTLDLVFDVEEDAYYQPKASMTMTYSQFGEAERVTKGLDPDKCTQIESLSLLKDLQQLIDDRTDAKKGSFTYSASQSASLMTQSEKQNQTNKVTFERTKDGLTYAMDVTGDGTTSYHAEYANSELSTETNGTTRTSKLDEDKAEKTIAELINDPAMGYNASYISNIEKTDTGYLVTMLVTKNSTLGRSVAASGASFGNGTHTIEFVLDGDELKSMTVHYKAQGGVTIDMGWNTSTATLHVSGSISVTFE